MRLALSSACERRFHILHSYRDRLCELKTLCVLPSFTALARSVLKHVEFYVQGRRTCLGSRHWLLYLPHTPPSFIVLLLPRVSCLPLSVFNTTTMTTPTTTHVDPKIIDLIKQESDSTRVSLEYFPPRTDEGVKVRTCASFFLLCFYFLVVVTHSQHTFIL